MNISGGESRRPAANVPPADETIKPRGVYRSFNYFGRTYTNDPELRRSANAKALRQALHDIFFSWGTQKVFGNGTELNDDFVWLLQQVVRRPIKTSEVSAILGNPAYSKSQKFFYLFYDVIFQDIGMDGFYWCESVDSNGMLTPIFKDRNDFITKYCDRGVNGQRFREFYIKRKHEILRFLRVVNEEDFFREITLAACKNDGSVVWIDTLTENQPTHLGNIRDFVKHMRSPSALSEMQKMINFLKKYRVTQNYQLVLRESEVKYVFRYSERGDLIEDDCIYAAAGMRGSAQYATEYNCYITLLKEYMNTFSPDEIDLGTVRFTRRDYSAEIEELVRLFLEAFFGDAEQITVTMRKEKAWFAKSLYERQALSGYVCENAPRIEKLLALLVEPTIEKYFDLFPSPKLYVKGKIVTVNQYIVGKITGETDVYTIGGILQSNMIANESFRRVSINTSALDAMYQQYQKMYENFIKNS